VRVFACDYDAYAVIYQIHDFCVNSFHYHNANSDDYYSHYRTLAEIAYEVASAAMVAFAGHNSSAGYLRIDDGYSEETIPSHLSYFDDDSADAIVGGEHSMAMNNKSRLVNEATLVP
jgi:hypothetical protein